MIKLVSVEPYQSCALYEKNDKKAKVTFCYLQWLK